MSGKGSSPRPYSVSQETFGNNYDNIFRKKDNTMSPSVEQMKKKWSIYPTPPHGTDGENFHFICRAHAYSIDPAVAKNMLAYVLQYGINTSLDRMLRADIFPIHQMNLFAYDESSQTSITNRAKGDRPSLRNDNLSI